MKKRNTSVGCGTCPIWHRHPKSVCGDCRLNPEAVEKLNTEWCSHHPDFWEAEAAKVSITYADGHTECVAVEQSEPPALERIATALETHLKLLQGGPILYGDVETAAEQGAPDCEPHALEEIARLLNDGEDEEALKDFRRMHGLVNRFVCMGCGYITNTVTSEGGKGFLCPECGAFQFEQRVVIEPKEATQ